MQGVFRESRSHLCPCHPVSPLSVARSFSSPGCILSLILCANTDSVCWWDGPEVSACWSGSWGVRAMPGILQPGAVAHGPGAWASLVTPSRLCWDWSLWGTPCTQELWASPLALTGKTPAHTGRSISGLLPVSKFEFVLLIRTCNALGA